MSNWSTENEIDFIHGMLEGKFTNYRQPAVSEGQMLKNYIKCALHRQENLKTPNINWDKCIATARILLSFQSEE